MKYTVAMAYSVGAKTRILLWTYLHFFTNCFYIGSVGCVQHNENVYVSGISSACGGMAEQIRASSGVITSPGWPFGYPSRINCSWNIHANPGEIITISFQDFEIQSSHRCGSDWISIGTYKNADSYRACGSSVPAPYISSQDHVWIKFHADDSLTAKGFRLSYITGKSEEISCDSDQFHCANGKCVPEAWKCNTMDECGTALTRTCAPSPTRRPPSPSSPAPTTSSPASPATPASTPASRSRSSATAASTARTWATRWTATCPPAGSGCAPSTAPSARPTTPTSTRRGATAPGSSTRATTARWCCASATSSWTARATATTSRCTTGWRRTRAGSSAC
ncbi:hypothetical protein COCON_G00011450 [Conger conger]|uniref:CUB domain-containing protein n=1 Tax=Conger conger TaxID=82655 RepID=A0A9Q1E2I4_CONCO|nr:hypothetical protein COCON_G00011450 [Conger conger]